MEDTRVLRKQVGPTGARVLRPGDHVGRWTIRRAIAEGGFGAVYEVEDPSGGRAALKLLHAHLATSNEMLARFDREVQIIARLRHPNIVQLIDAGFTDDHRPYLSMELLEGEELRTLIDRRHGLPANVAFLVLEALCDALALAHDHNIIHRDIKASNVLVCPSADDGELGRVVLLDFGIAKLADALAPELTATHQSLGTPACMAPEQIEGRRADARVDVYALGGLVFHMLTGQLAFDDPSTTMSQYLHLHARRPRASSIVEGSQRVDELIIRAMAIDPDERFPDVQSLVAAARVAMTEPTATGITVGVAGAILVVASDLDDGADFDEALFADLETVLSDAERFLGGHGCALALDLGSSALFVARPSSELDPREIALALWEHLQSRARKHVRVQLGIAVHRDEATFVGEQIEAKTLLRPSTWGIPDQIEGVWITSAFDPSTPGGTRVR